MAKEDALLDFQYECGVCAKYPHAKGLRGLTLNGMSDSLFDVYQNLETSKELYDTLEAKYMAEDASSKKFLVSCIIDKILPLWKDFKHTLKHLKEELTLVELGSHLRIKESLRVQDSDKPKDNNVGGPSVVNMVKHNNSSRYNDNKGKRKHHDTRANPNKKPKVTCWKCRKPGHLKKVCKAGNVGNKANGLGIKGSEDGSSNPLKGHVHFKRMQYMSKDRLIPSFDMAAIRLRDPKLRTLGERGIECIFVGYAEHSKACRFYVIEPNDSIAINSIIESKDDIFVEHRFSSVPKPSQRSLKDGTKDSSGSVVSERVTEEVFWQCETELRKSKRHRTPKGFGPEFQLCLFEGTRNKKEAINDEMDSIMGNNTWVLTDLPSGCRPLGCKWIFKSKLKVDGTVEKFKARLVIQGFKQKSGIDYFDTYAPMARISIIRLLIAMASIHNLIIHQMDVKTTFLNEELEEEVYMNQPLGFIMSGNENKVCKLIKSLYELKQAPNKFDGSGKGVIICLYVDDMLIFGTDQVQVDLTKEFLSSRFFIKDMREADVILGIRIKHESNVLKGYTDASWISNTEDNSSITVGKEAEWLKNLLLEIPLWVKPIAPISIRCDSAATLAKAYSQMYNGKSRHLGVRHSMIRELITNGVWSLVIFIRGLMASACNSLSKLKDTIWSNPSEEIITPEGIKVEDLDATVRGADIYATGSETRPLMLNKENYVPWSSRLLRYAKSRPNGKKIHNSILNGPYVRRMIAEPGDGERDVN
nr:zinc finger, CCHC-type [Tanacetum cinerariifolium]